MKLLSLCLGLFLLSDQTHHLSGRWKVEFKFSGNEEHSLRFVATSEGKGSFLLLDAGSNLNPPAEPMQAQWEQTVPRKVTFSGGTQFAIGNVGRDAGTLVFKGSFETSNAISGKVFFFREGQNPKDPDTVPAKTGDFKATRY